VNGVHVDQEFVIVRVLRVWNCSSCFLPLLDLCSSTDLAVSRLAMVLCIEDKPDILEKYQPGHNPGGGLVEQTSAFTTTY